MTYFWVDGKFIDKKNSLFSLELGALHYGSVVFDGILAIETPEKNKKKVALFRPTEHIDRFLKSANIMGLNLKYSNNEIMEIIEKTIRFNSLNSYYIRPVLFSKTDYFKLLPGRSSARLAILLKPFYFRLFALKMKIPVSLICCDNIINPFSGGFSSLKVSGRYLINILAKRQARRLGFDDAILFSHNGYVTEATSANIFILRKGEVKTPPLGNIIDGITRRTVIEILASMGISVIERKIAKEELLDSDAIFTTGTATGIVSVKQIEKTKLNSSHELIQRLQKKYIQVITAQDDNFGKYLI